uniref:Uncharacterized protein n=1 Tax=Anguilla anguilla TaxID=7936 RepID=A0A0E9PVG0_ANGAN
MKCHSEKNVLFFTELQKL